MGDLTAAHRGYEYQDLLVACRLVDLLLGTAVEVRVDEKLVDGDLLDDLATQFSDGSRERAQIKHTEDRDRPLRAGSFTRSSRRLPLDRVFSSVLADRDGPGAGAAQQTYRIVLRDAPPVDSRLTGVLGPAYPDPGPFLPTLETVRLAFDADALWSQMDQRPAEVSGAGRGFFSFLADNDAPLSYPDLVWACSRLVVEVGAPAASLDLVSPGPAEALLLRRVRDEVGAGLFPNLDRGPVDVAAAIIGGARRARLGAHSVTREDVLRLARLRTDFGAVAREHPVDPRVQVPRATAVQRIAETAGSLVEAGGAVLVVGPPGQGKSWLCHQVKEELSDQGWLVAEHYCYLGDADSEKSERVLAERVFGSLVARLADDDPRVVEGQRPALSADEDSLTNCIARSIRCEPDRPVALVIDGVDHITRVRAADGAGFDPSLSIAESLASLEVPAGSVLIVLSQRGSHLSPLEQAGAKTIEVDGLDEAELRALAANHSVVPAADNTGRGPEAPFIEDTDEIAEFLDALAERSAGNALYATYLCSEAKRPEAALLSPAATVRSLPAFDGTLEEYYEHLYSTLGSESGWVADLICLVDFAVTRDELGAIRPDADPRVDMALRVLAPVLVERAVQGGIRVYHESFARYLRRSFQDNPAAVSSLLDHITAWLETQGMFEDSRAFRSLLPLLAEAGRNEKAVALVKRDFVVRAVAAGFPASAIVSNLAAAIRCAARLGEWPLVAGYVEMSRAAESFEAERLSSSLVEFADVQSALLGPAVVAERLLHDGRMVMAARDGIQMCAAVDVLGAVAPWEEYLAGYERESKTDNTSYGKHSDRAVALALLRGWLRLAASEHLAVAGPDGRGGQGGADPAQQQHYASEDDEQAQLGLIAPIDWGRAAVWMAENQLDASDVVQAVADTHGVDGVRRLIACVAQPGAMCLALAEYLKQHPDKAGTESAQLWAAAAAGHGIPSGRMHIALSIDKGILEDTNLIEAVSRDDFFALTRRVQEHSIQWEVDDLHRWLDACAVAAHLDPLGLSTAEGLISGEGWYRCWLRFTTGLARAEAADPEERPALALEALRCLEEDLNPFSGDPRACDLFAVQPAISETIQRAMALIDHDRWAAAIGLLQQVSTSITTTLSGEVGGPLPPDFVAAIAVAGSSSERRAVAEEVLAEQIENKPAGRFYTDLADFQLLSARLALASDDSDEALQCWERACLMMTSYGWRKDITIFELLDPLPNLIAADRRRGQERLAMAQPLCERIPSHTDGRETHGAWTQWWHLLALADPVALARLVVPGLLRRCNLPNWLYHEALEELWRLWWERADPVVAGALRLTLDTPLGDKDADLLSRLVESPATDDEPAELGVWLLSRADERPMSYGSSNSSEILEVDDQQVAALNSVAATAGLPVVMNLRPELADPDEQQPPDWPESTSMSPGDDDCEDPLSSLPPGTAGLAQAIRAWRKRPYDTAHPVWSADRFADTIRSFLLELADTGRDQDAAQALRTLADACEIGRRAELLGAVAERLDQSRSPRLAATAYTLAWTRARGGGGWVNFGGETEIRSLRRATELDPALALGIVAEEAERIVASGRYGTYGVTQALIHAFCAGALSVPGKQPVDVAFAAWDEALTAIEMRAPRVHESEDPEDPYTPADGSGSEPCQDDLDEAFTLAVLGSLAHPGREKKRRTLLAAGCLISERPDASAAALDVALDALSDPATTTWLLRLIDLGEGVDAAAVAQCRQTLSNLATGQHLVVRALARRLLDGQASPMPPPDPADPALLGEKEVQAVPLHIDESESDEFPGISRLVREAAGYRLSRAESMLPGLEEAVCSRAASAMGTERFRKLLNSQLDAYADRHGKHIPDVYLFDEQTIEEALQLAAAGGRYARIAAGEGTPNPAAWESDLADILLDDPALPLAVEKRRIPRPPIPAPPPPASPIWADVPTSASADSEDGTHGLPLGQFGPFTATTQIEPGESTRVVEQGQYRGWRMIATVEELVKQHPERSERSSFLAERYQAVELRNPDDGETLDMPPMALGDFRLWHMEVGLPSDLHLPDHTLPVVGIDFAAAGARDRQHGLGVHSPLLSPTLGLIALLALYPGGPFTLNDNQGCGLTLVTWRAAYETTGHHLPIPRLLGSAVLIRPDLFERLQAAAAGRLVLRDFAALANVG